MPHDVEDEVLPSIVSLTCRTPDKAKKKVQCNSLLGKYTQVLKKHCNFMKSGELTASKFDLRLVR